MSKKPIQFVEQVDIRISDLDMYGHVNSKHYIDLVSTARLVFMADKMKTPIEEVTKRGIGFYMTKSTILYRKPIVGLQKVLVSSFVQEIRDEKTLVIPFVISTPDQQKIFADGVLEFMLVDMVTKRTTGIVDWVEDLLFEGLGE